MRQKRVKWLRERARALYVQYHYADYHIPFKKMFQKVKEVWKKEGRLGLELKRG